MNLRCKFTLCLALGLSLQTMARAQEPHVRGELPTVDLIASIARPSIDNTRHGPALDRAIGDVAIDTAKKQLLDPDAMNWRDAAVFLACHENGRPVLEEVIIHFRMTDNVRWTETFAEYAQHVAPNQVPERMIPEYVADLQLQQTCAGTIAALNRIAEFGTRGKGAALAVQWVRDFSLDPEQVEAASEAIRRINGGRKLRMFTGC